MPLFAFLKKKIIQINETWLKTLLRKREDMLSFTSWMLTSGGCSGGCWFCVDFRPTHFGPSNKPETDCSVDELFQTAPCWHRVIPSPRIAARNGVPSLSCFSVSSWCTRSTRCGCSTASWTPNPATEAEESTASPPTWLPGPNCR